MIIKADKEGQQAIGNLCDVGLRTGGLKNLDAITKILNSVKPLDGKPVPVKVPEKIKRKHKKHGR